ncbi:ribose/xylose/arabinose/galactoside ABC-type transport system permease subunit [Angulomicrobium tetraedrale]|uniref:Ribose/xylose/arabinose/galactoside ABC-type transport system permease subunit n=1 Tax=Ancylobacter tetraedralis TaxID=217068 RepID=A0A839ZFW4_9HYPH|nr:ABC transporter permease [Ancylobacter tetraedralis]MBB3773664.1 ribose/xylose/arabinose/galactoside ABC-type transport system permease subunit [Ancylobacter tetraedralis]
MMAKRLPGTSRPLRLSRPPAVALVCLGLFLLCCAFVPRFATFGNIENVLRVASILCVVACGQAVVILLGGIEFSFGASAALASVVTVMALPVLGPVGGLATGGASVIAIGAVNGFLVGRLALPPVIVTLGTLMMASGAAAWLVGGLPIDAPPSAAFSWPARGRVLGVPVPILAALLACAALHLMLAHGRIGRLWYHVGANPVAARLAGLDVTRITTLGYAVAGAFCAVGAIILTSRVASGQPALAPNLPFETIAACAIGGLPLSGGRGRVSQVVFGVLTVAMLNNAVVLINLPVAWQLVLLGLAVLAAVGLQKDWAVLARLARRTDR